MVAVDLHGNGVVLTGRRVGDEREHLVVQRGGGQVDGGQLGQLGQGSDDNAREGELATDEERTQRLTGGLGFGEQG